MEEEKEPKEKVDLVYLLNTSGGGTLKEDLEVRYSLRSACKHFKSLGKVFIAGERLPEWATGIRLLKCDEPKKTKARLLAKEECLTNKVLTACKSKLVSTDFLRMCDDYIFALDTDVNWFRENPLARTDLNTAKGKAEGRSYYGRHWLKTGYSVMQSNYLRKMADKLEKPVIDYEVHCPILVNKKQGIETVNKLGTTSTFCSGYGNMWLPDPFMDGMFGNKHRAQVRGRHSMGQVKTIMKGKRFLNWNEQALRHRTLMTYLRTNLGEPCRFEK